MCIYMYAYIYFTIILEFCVILLPLFIVMKFVTLSAFSQIFFWLFFYSENIQKNVPYLLVKCKFWFFTFNILCTWKQTKIQKKKLFDMTFKIFFQKIKNKEKQPNYALFRNIFWKKLEFLELVNITWKGTLKTK